MYYKDKYPNLYFLLESVEYYDGSGTDLGGPVGGWDQIHGGHYHRVDKIMRELSEAEQDPLFDWRVFVSPVYEYMYKALPDLTSNDVFEYIKIFIWSALVPEYRFSKLKYETLRRTIFYVLRDIALVCPNWIEIEFLISCIKLMGKEWHLLERFHIEYIRFDTSRLSSNYLIIETQRKVNSDFDITTLNPIQKLRVRPQSNNTILELLPNFLINGYIEYIELNEGYGMIEFNWSRENSILVHQQYMQYLNSK
jgi:hypothetical protein